MNLYFRYVSANIRSILQYRKSFILSVIGQLVVTVSGYVGMIFMFQRFGEIKEFTLNEITFCYGVVLLSLSISELIFKGFDQFEQTIRKGDLDRLLVRPRGIIFQVLGEKFDITRIGRIIQSIVMLIWGILKLQVEWNIIKIVLVFFMVIFGTILFSSLYVLYASLCFFFLDNLEIFNIFTDGAREFGKYPVNVYGKKVFAICTFIIPYSLVQYFPMQYIFEISNNPWLVLYPFLSLLFLIPTILIWNWGLSKYQSSGN